MSQTVINSAVEEAAIRAVYELQYNTQKAARFIVNEVPSTSMEFAVSVVNSVVRGTPKKTK